MNIKRFAKGVFISTALYGFTHVFVLILYGLTHGVWDQMNVFGILGFDLFFPHITEGALSNILSAIVIIAVYVIMYIILSFNEKKTSK